MNKTLQPLLKWPGGKRWLSDQIISYFPKRINTYYEPFLGGGAVFFKLSPHKSVLSDSNEQLIQTYQTVRKTPSKIIDNLKKMSISEKQYYLIRSKVSKTKLKRTIRFIYLNKAAFNGMYRVNRMGQFNVPFGCKPGTILCDEIQIRKTVRCPF